MLFKTEKDDRKYSPNGSKGTKDQSPEDIEEEVGRSSKQLAVYMEEDELSEMFLI